VMDMLHTEHPFCYACLDRSDAMLSAQAGLAGGHYIIKRRFQSKRAQRYIRSQLFPSTFV
jgi:hypothetical protein